jgi:hypothetical protein
VEGYTVYEMSVPKGKSPGNVVTHGAYNFATDAKEERTPAVWYGLRVVVLADNMAKVVPFAMVRNDHLASWVADAEANGYDVEKVD